MNLSELFPKGSDLVSGWKATQAGTCLFSFVADDNPDGKQSLFQTALSDSVPLQSSAILLCGSSVADPPHIPTIELDCAAHHAHIIIWIPDRLQSLNVNKPFFKSS